MLELFYSLGLSPYSIQYIYVRTGPLFYPVYICKDWASILSSISMQGLSLYSIQYIYVRTEPLFYPVYLCKD